MMAQLTTNSVILSETAMIPIVDQSQRELTLSVGKLRENIGAHMKSESKLKANHG